ncbi:S8 family serine peptidase [candidate division KSB1 bacterium]|nr:S8 family serine peptidase [candidate division KSB1 bacterium]
MRNRLIMRLFFSVFFLATAGFATEQDNYVPGELIVKLGQKSAYSALGNISALHAISHKYGIQSVEAIFSSRPTFSALDNLFLCRTAKDVDLQQLAAQMSGELDIEYVQPNYLHRTTVTPNDPFISQQYYLAQIQAYEAWDYSKGARDVIIAIIDTGVDYDHTDLAANIWTNADEVIDGLDNDANGYIDDIRGYDFVDNAGNAAPGEDGDEEDNDPIDFHGHGTNVAGIASAVTNNATGIAGVGWGCAIMPIRAGYQGSDGNGYLASAAIIKAIYYATDNGADIINASFGGIPDDFAQRDVFRYAFMNGLVIVKAAGNNSSAVPETPGQEDWILSVASVTSNDTRSNFSNYGRWVKISAPGSGIYTTSRNNRYSTLQGTSVAAPMVAGVAGLVKTAHPDWTAAQIMMHIVDTADNIDAMNPDYKGELGKKGRLNAVNALSTPFQSRPELVVRRVTVEDWLTGNGDARLNVGETSDLVIRIANRWSDAANVTLTLSTDDPSIQVLDNTSSFACIPGIASSMNYVDTVDDLLRVQVDDHAFPHNVHFTLAISADGGFEQTIGLQIGIEARLLFVDDDDGQLNVEDYYFSALDSIGMPYDIWDRSTQGNAGARLRNYDMIIWSCESAMPTLDDSDTEDLQSFLRQSKRLFIAGQNIAWDLCAPQTNEDASARNYLNQYRQTNGGSKLFYENYLQASFENDASSYSLVQGVASDAIGSGLSFAVFEPLRSAAEQSRDVIGATSYSAAVFQYPDGQVAATRSDRLGKVINFAFGGFEAIADESARLTVMRRIIDEFTGLQVSVADLVYVEGLGDDFVVQALVRSTAAPAAVRLYWRTLDQQLFTMAPMAACDSLYQATIPVPAHGSVLEYGVQAVAESGLYSPIRMKRLKIVKPVPAVTAATVKKTSLSCRPFVQMVASHVAPIDTASARVLFWNDVTPLDSLQLQHLGGTLFGGEIVGGFKHRDSLFYQFSVLDRTANPARGVSPVYSMVVGVEDFESGLDDWHATEGGWGLETLRKNSGSYSLHESPNGDYPDNAELIVTLKRGLDLSNLSEATLSLWMLYGFPSGDAGYVEASHDGGQTWATLALPIEGAAASFYNAQFSLSDYTGPGMHDVLIRFRFNTDEANSGPGWFIDDVSILPIATAVAGRDGTPPAEFELSRNYPNPFNSTTTIRYTLPAEMDVRLVIYNTRGQQVVTLVNGKQSAGSFAACWDGFDSDGNLVPSGLYFYKLDAGGLTAVNKMTVIK